MGVDLKRGDFKVSVRREVLVSLSENVIVVADEALEFAAVDVIKLFAVGPGLFEIVDFKTAVGRDPGWLDGTKVVSCLS